MAKKRYILDTTVLLYDSGALFAFEDNDVIVPIMVIEEIDRFKKDLSETGRNARQVSRILDSLRHDGKLTDGIKLDTGGTLAIRSASSANLSRVPSDFSDRRRDAFIFAVAMDVHDESSPSVIVSKDVCLRIKADSLNIIAEDYESERIDFEELYSGHAIQTVPTAIIDKIRLHKAADWKDGDLLPNQYVTLIDSQYAENIAYGRYDAGKGAIVPLIPLTQNINLRIKVRNPEQAFALDALLDDSIELVSLVGKAGTGKTLLAVAASLYKTVDENIFHRILISRPTLPMGKDIGFLPGNVEEKLTPWMYPIADNVELLMRYDTGGKTRMRSFKELVEIGVLVIEPLTYIRGRSIHNQYLIVDEAQNLTPHELKTIITRVGSGTKIVLTGDPYQIDNPYIDSSSNGLSVVVEKFKKQSVAGHVTMTKGERSVLSELAANLL